MEWQGPGLSTSEGGCIEQFRDRTLDPVQAHVSDFLTQRLTPRIQHVHIFRDLPSICYCRYAQRHEGLCKAGKARKSTLSKHFCHFPADLGMIYVWVNIAREVRIGVEKAGDTLRPSCCIHHQSSRHPFPHFQEKSWKNRNGERPGHVNLQTLWSECPRPATVLLLCADTLMPAQPWFPPAPTVFDAKKHVSVSMPGQRHIYIHNSRSYQGRIHQSVAHHESLYSTCE